MLLGLLLPASFWRPYSTASRADRVSQSRSKHLCIGLSRTRLEPVLPVEACQPTIGLCVASPPHKIDTKARGQRLTQQERLLLAILRTFRDRSTFNATLAALAKTGTLSFESVVALLRGMWAWMLRSVFKQEQTPSVAIRAVQLRKWLLAVSLTNDMAGNWDLPDELSCDAAFAACKRASQACMAVTFLNTVARVGSCLLKKKMCPVWLLWRWRVGCCLFCVLFCLFV